jgi:hypothetical protein
VFARVHINVIACQMRHRSLTGIWHIIGVVLYQYPHTQKLTPKG